VLLSINCALADERPVRGNPLDTLPRPELIPGSRALPKVNEPVTPSMQTPTSPSPEQISIVPRHYQVLGMNAVPLSLVAPRLAATAGKPLTLQQLGVLAASITDEYKQRG
jgi:hemolysin activation/secretion protein